MNTIKTLAIPRQLKLLFIVFFMIIISCEPGFDQIVINPEFPEFTSNKKLQLERSQSLLNLPIKIPLSNIEKVLNTIPSTFPGTESDITDLLSDDTLTYQINRDDLSIGVRNNKITFSAPISGTASIKGKIYLRLFSQDFSATVNFAGTISGDFSLDIDYFEFWKVINQ